MIIFKKDFNLKTVLIVTAVFASALFVDANFSTSNNSENIQEARFLGIGNKVSRTPCFMGVQNVSTQFTFLWINVGSASTGQVPC